MTGSTSRHARVYLNIDGVLSTTADWTYYASSSATAIAVMDMNYDGYLNLAVATARQPAMVFLNTLPPSSVPDADSFFPATRLLVSPQPALVRSHCACRILRAGSRVSLSSIEPTGVIQAAGWLHCISHPAASWKSGLQKNELPSQDLIPIARPEKIDSGRR
ncbi:MAG: hypothetical protein KJ970_13705 [Candidatus Eisenbacteria bacterium]|uniref:Uncharacterized protein n=1 Tax=Eiseniibacteriota bacterium TaxID=2212470 RepID=A0A948RVU5_UNCEI|nr:hypothetical protein [Candidatus Eisenbacteria bacterium]MBU1950718.1 hypothetical protein [Candidatus Eisenbacteria bacterium]MBU2691970.1 hypothetical protein [Candidatus Eisenbacteria bacterium]